VAGLIKEKQIPVANKDKLKPGKVIEIVQAGLGNPQVEKNGRMKNKFNQDTFVRCWKKYKIRPENNSPNPERTEAQYCVYDEPNGSYLYTYDFVEFVAKKGRPIIISTGIAYEEEIQDVVQICKNAGNSDIALLKCTSSYPAPLNGMNLQTIANMREKFGVEVGFSDHTLGVTAPVVAVSLGARIVEKHFILDKSVKSVDSAFSLDESEFALMTKCVREAEELLGVVNYELDEKAVLNRRFSRSLYASADIKKGEIFSEQNIRSVRPGYGLHPKFLKELIGKKAKRDIKFSERLTKEDLI